MNSAMGGWHGGPELRGLRDRDVLLAFVAGLVLAVSWRSTMVRSFSVVWAAVLKDRSGIGAAVRRGLRARGFLAQHDGALLFGVLGCGSERPIGNWRGRTPRVHRDGVADFSPSPRKRVVVERSHRYCDDAYHVRVSCPSDGKHTAHRGRPEIAFSARSASPFGGSGA